MKIDGRFWLSKEGENFLGSGRIELLNRIEKTGSIHAAAKEMKMSYKAAWERLNSMNNLADEPLITKTAGGKGGGGTLLTPYAHKLIKTFNRFNELHRQFIDRFAEAGDNPERLAKILNRTFLTTSARNQLPSKIDKIEFDELHADIKLSFEGGSLTSAITTKSAKNMGLEVGNDVYAIIKSNDIDIVIRLPQNTQNINIIEGTIEQIEHSKESIEISLLVSEQTRLTALLNNRSASEFKVGERVYALIHKSSIIIGY